MIFEDVLDQHKKNLTEALILFGEGKRLNKILAEVEQNRPEYYLFYQAGKDSKQKEFDENDPNFHLVIDKLCMDEIINEVNSYGKIKSFD